MKHALVRPVVLCALFSLLLAPGTLAAQVEIDAAEAARELTELEAANMAAADAAISAEEPTGLAGISVKSDRYEFSHSYPISTKKYSKLFQYLGDEETRLAEDFEKLVDEDYKKADESGDSIALLYEMDIMWGQETDIPGFLSLSRFWYEVTGSPQGMYGNTGLIWNKQDNEMQNPLSLFTSAAAFDQSVQAEFCDKLDIEREKKRGRPIMRNSGDRYDTCIDPTEQSILLQSSNNNSFDHLIIYAGPHQAGPYDEEDYAIKMPVTAAVIAAVKPTYRSSFSIGEISDSAITSPQ